MNNEEKILSMLEELTAKVDRLESGQAELRGAQAEMRSDLAEMRETLTRVAVTQENIVLPRLDTLAEGHKHLLDTLASKSRVEALEDDVSTLKTVVKSMSQRLAALEKAQ